MSSATRLWILSLNYAPEPTGFAPHATALAEYLAQRGHDITVITGFPFAPGWKRWPEYGRAFSSQTIENKVAIRRVSHFIPRRAGAMWQRVAMEASFCLAAAVVLSPRLLHQRARPDAVLYIGAQPALAMLARWIGAVTRAPYFVNVNDLAAQTAADVGILRAGWMQRVLEKVEFAAYLPAAGASVLCRSFGEALIAKGYPADRIRVIRSPINLDLIRPLPFRSEYREALRLPMDAFVVLFAGSMGLKQDLTNVVEAARRARDREGDERPIVWVLVGDGEMRGRLVQLAKQHDLDDAVRLLPFQPDDSVSQMLAAADILLLNQRASVKDTVIPSKLLIYMAAGRPVLAAVNSASQGADILREANGGMLVAPEDPLALVRGVEALINAGPEPLAAMGARNRAYAEQHFDQRTILAEHESLILGHLAHTRQRRGMRTAA
jgi:glycosyltransferase involved in cell wall biosynthesis